MARQKNEAPEAVIVSVDTCGEVPMTDEGKPERRAVVVVIEDDPNQTITQNRTDLGHDPKNHIGMLLRTMVLRQEGGIPADRVTYNGKNKTFTLPAGCTSDYLVKFRAASLEVEAPVDASVEDDEIEDLEDEEVATA